MAGLQTMLTMILVAVLGLSCLIVFIDGLYNSYSMTTPPELAFLNQTVDYTIGNMTPIVGNVTQQINGTPTDLTQNPASWTPWSFIINGGFSAVKILLDTPTIVLGFIAALDVSMGSTLPSVFFGIVAICVTLYIIFRIIYVMVGREV